MLLMAYFDKEVFPVVSEFAKLPVAKQREVVLENKKKGFGSAVEMVQRFSIAGYTTGKPRVTGSAS